MENPIQSQRLFTMALLISTILGTDQIASADDAGLRFYIGTAANADTGGIFLSSIALETGALTAPKLAAATDRSTFIALHPSQPVLYSIAELSAGERGKGGGILAWKIDPTTGELAEISRQTAGGQGPCFVTVRNDAKYAAIANYGSGSISLYPLEKDGQVSPASANIQHQGQGRSKDRQASPHAHSVRFDPTKNRLLAADLGTDDIFIYDISDDGSLKASDPLSLKMPPGSGPRHFVFSPDHRFVLGLGELSGVISSFAFNPAVNPSPVSTTSTMAAGTLDTANRSSAEILFHPRLPIVYCSNRGPHEIAVFDYNASSGAVTRRSALACGGQVPRNFRITPDGKYLLVANQGSNNIAVLSIDQSTGDLSSTSHTINVPAPMCIKFVGDQSL